MKHVTKIELEQSLDGTLPFVKTAFVKLHLMGCPGCRRQLEKMCEERKEFERMAVVVRKLEEADQKSAQITRQTVASVFKTSTNLNE
jgi:predicted anti-sigma-YlaC factor YlaD